MSATTMPGRESPTFYQSHKSHHHHHYGYTFFSRVFTVLSFRSSHCSCPSWWASLSLFSPAALGDWIHSLSLCVVLHRTLELPYLGTGPVIGRLGGWRPWDSWDSSWRAPPVECRVRFTLRPLLSRSTGCQAVGAGPCSRHHGSAISRPPTKI